MEYERDSLITNTTEEFEETPVSLLGLAPVKP
jgi:hypothetical protein